MAWLWWCVPASRHETQYWGTAESGLQQEEGSSGREETLSGVPADGVS